MGTCVVMGRKTWESLPERFRPLPGRTNIVLTRQTSFEAAGAFVAHSKDEVFNSKAFRCDEMVIIGGSEIYSLFLEDTHKIYMTVVDVELEGDAHFPTLRSDEWLECDVLNFAADAQNEYAHTFKTMLRR